MYDIKKQEIKKKKEAEIKKLQSELDKIRGIQTQINERLESAPPESDAAVKNKPLPKDDYDHDEGGNPGFGAGTSQVEVQYLLIPNNSLMNIVNSISNTISNTKLNDSSIDNLAFSSKSFKDYLFPSKNYIKPIFANSNIKTGVTIYNNKLNNLNNFTV